MPKEEWYVDLTYIQKYLNEEKLSIFTCHTAIAVVSHMMQKNVDKKPTIFLINLQMILSFALSYPGSPRHCSLEILLMCLGVRAGVFGFIPSVTLHSFLHLVIPFRFLKERGILVGYVVDIMLFIVLMHHILNSVGVFY